jgi:hypothetical protein
MSCRNSKGLNATLNLYALSEIEDRAPLMKVRWSDGNFISMGPY